MYPKLQYISQGHTSEEHLTHIKKALDAGCEWVQLRMKQFPVEEIEATAIKAKELCTNHKATFILNDHVTIAHKINADGLHLGLSDMSVTEARTILGHDTIIGGTANTIEDVIKRTDEKCDYIGLGPFRFTETKENLSPVLGLKGYKQIINQLNDLQRQTPIYAIGGITANDIESIVNTGIYGIAVSGIITNAKQKKELVAQFNQLLYATS